jgi:hypothetical protein
MNKSILKKYKLLSLLWFKTNNNFNYFKITKDFILASSKELNTSSRQIYRYLKEFKDSNFIKEENKKISFLLNISNIKLNNKSLENEFKLLTHINGLSKNQPCKASTKYLANSIGKSIRQTFRYLKNLQKDGYINIKSTLLTKYNIYRCSRKIKITKPIENIGKAYYIRNEYFLKIKASNSLPEKTQPQPKEAEQDFSKQFENPTTPERSYQESQSSWPGWSPEIHSDSYSPPPSSSLSDVYGILRREHGFTEEQIQEEMRKDEEENKAILENKNNMWIREETDKIWGSREGRPQGKTNLDQLAYAHKITLKENYDEIKGTGIWDALKTTFLPPIENVFIENNEYYVKLFFEVSNETIEYKTKILEYYPWDKDSWEFKELKRQLS